MNKQPVGSRVDPAIHSELQTLAQEKDMTVSNLVETLLKKGLKVMAESEKKKGTPVKSEINSQNPSNMKVHEISPEDLSKNRQQGKQGNPISAEDVEELKKGLEDVRAKLEGIETVSDQEPYECGNCGYKADEKYNPCPECGTELEWPED